MILNPDVRPGSGRPRRVARSRPALAALAWAAIAVGSACDRPPMIHELDSPAGPGSAEPNLTAGPDGLYLSWLEATGSGDDAHALRFARWDGRTWSEPRTVIDRDSLFVNWADFPSMLALDDGTLAAHWLQRRGTGPYAYDVRMALSRDEGRTWSDDVLPHRDSVEAEHGFVSLFPLNHGLGAVWLDGRETVEGRPMTLRSTVVGTDGSLGREQLLDSSTCDCCQTDVAVADGVPVAVYRGRTAEEVRDIRVVRRVGGTWTDPAVVHRDGWMIHACPVNGPAIDAVGRRVAVAWFTAAPNREPGNGAGPGAAEHGRVLLAFSEDGGGTFGAPISVDDRAPLGRVDIELLEDGRAMVLWLARTGDGAVVRLQTFDADGGRGAAASLGTTSAERVSGFPRMAVRQDEVLFAYTESGTDGGPTRVRTLRAELRARELDGT